MSGGGDSVGSGTANKSNPLGLHSGSGVNLLANAFDNSWRDILQNPEREHFRLDRNSVNQLIMNYLLTEGFKEAAEKFQCEAGLPANTGNSWASVTADRKDDSKNRPTDTLKDRDTIRQAIQDGAIEEAIALCNELYPELLDNNAYLYFHLKQQHLLELIRNQRVEEAIEYAQEHLTEKSGDDPKIMEEIERSMALLAFDDPLNSPFGDLLQMCHRQKVASEVNMAILQSEEVMMADPLDNPAGSPGFAASLLHSGNAKPSLLFLRNMMLVMQDSLEKNKVKPDRKMTAHGHYTDGTDSMQGHAASATTSAAVTTAAAVTAAAAIALGDPDIPMAT